MRHQTDKQLSLVICSHCGHVDSSSSQQCSLCNSVLHIRKKDSLMKTLSFAIMSMIFFIPANFLPMMHVTTLGEIESSTIFDGIVYFFQTQSYGIALVIFVASIFVPIFKIFVLFGLLLIVYYRKSKYANIGTKLYRVIHFIGKWSMIDIFVVALMVVMIQFENLSNVSAGVAAPAFTMVVIMTILATHSFDTRLLWDTKTEGKSDDS